MEPLDSVFLEARALRNPGERAAFLARACGADPELRERIQAMLNDADAADAFFGPEDHPLEAEDAGPSEPPGTVVGRFTILEKIGEGGMGEVYRAEQREPVVRNVALKIIKPGLDTRQVVARFEAERQALALMDHPNIAKVLDGGATGSGRPYFVMELVQGLPITQCCETAEMPARARLELFLDVCSAVQHAHQKGIIHRDLKPSNILVALHGDKAVPKVIDFGVAKATQQRLTEKTLFTQFQQFIGTPAYMSPEQTGLGGLDVDTRTDVYSLGVLLYELLTGRPPFDGKDLLNAGWEGMCRTICEKEPQTPSKRLTELAAASTKARKAASGAGNASSEMDRATLRRQRQEKQELIHLVRGDLDWIVMKCLEKDRTRRYETANGLAADIRRHLNDEPVIARPPTVRYRLHKSLRRHRTAFAAGAVVALVLLAGTLVSTLAAIRATRAQAEELRLRQLAEAARESAKKEERLATTAELLARRRYYAAQMNLAMQAWDAGQPARTLELLETQRPGTGRQDLRDFEWFHLWGLCNARLRFALGADGNSVTGAAFSPDGSTLAASSSDGTIRLCNPAIPRQVRRLKIESPIDTIAFSPDGTTLASGSQDHLVRLWEVASGKVRDTLEGHPAWVRSLAISPDGRTLVAGGDGGAVTRWDLATRTARATVVAGRVSDGRVLVPVVVALAFSPDGSTLASGNGWGWERGGTLRLNPSQDPLQPGIQIHDVASIAFSPDGKTLADAAWRVIQLWDATTGKLRGTLKGHAPPVNSLAYLPDGKGLVSCAQDRTIRFWKLNPEAVTNSESWILGTHLDTASCVAVSKDGTMAASGSTDGSVKVWSLAETQEAAEARFAASFQCDISTPFENPWSLMPAPGGNAMFITTRGGTEIHDTSSGARLAVIPDMTGRGALSPDGKLFATTEHTGILKLWEVGGTRLRASVQAHPVASFAPAIAFSPDGRTIATGSFESDSRLRLWDAGADLKPSRAIDTDGVGFGAVGFSPDGRRLAAAIRHRRVVLIDVAAGRIERVINLGSGGVETHATVFSPDGKLLATSGEGGTVELWNVETGELRAELKGHTTTVYAVAFSPDGGTVASASGDQTVKLWDVAAGQERATLTRHREPVKAVAFSPDGNALLSVDRNGTGWILRRVSKARADEAWVPSNHSEPRAAAGPGGN